MGRNWLSVFRPPVEHITKTKDEKLKFWGPKLGDSAPDSLITPEVLRGDTLAFAGQRIEIVGLESKTPNRNVLWIPSIQTVLGGILLDSGEHVWLADTAAKEQREVWVEQLSYLEGLDVKTVIPGHYQGKLPTEAKEVIRFTKGYLQVAEKELAQAKNAQDFVQAMKAYFPDLPGDDALELGAKVLTGEIQWE